MSIQGVRDEDVAQLATWAGIRNHFMRAVEERLVVAYEVYFGFG